MKEGNERRETKKFNLDMKKESFELRRLRF